MNGWKMRKEGDVPSVGRLLMLNLLRSRRRAEEEEQASSQANQETEGGKGSESERRSRGLEAE